MCEKFELNPIVQQTHSKKFLGDKLVQIQGSPTGSSKHDSFPKILLRNRA
jgi:hypothetical protein